MFDAYSSHYIGKYGPYMMDAHFTFSDFAAWGGAKSHNNGFDECIKSCVDVDCVFDIGAHIGLVSLPISSVISEIGKVYAFEPAAANIKYLKRHINKNNIKNIQVVETLVGENEKEDIEFYEMSATSGMNSVVPKGTIDNYKKVSKKQISIDAYCLKNNLKPNVIKIDVEGAEIAVLKGAIKIIVKDKPLIFLSYHPREINNIGLSEKDLFEFINSVHYKCIDMHGNEVSNLSLSEYVLKPS